MTYQWQSDTKSQCHRLNPVGTPFDNAAGSLAWVRPTLGASSNRFRAQYNYARSTGNKPTAWAEFRSVGRAKRWVESELARFWDPPAIVAEKATQPSRAYKPKTPKALEATP